MPKQHNKHLTSQSAGLFCPAAPFFHIKEAQIENTGEISDYQKGQVGSKHVLSML